MTSDQFSIRLNSVLFIFPSISPLPRAANTKTSPAKRAQFVTLTQVDVD